MRGWGGLEVYNILPMEVLTVDEFSGTWITVAKIVNNDDSDTYLCLTSFLTFQNTELHLLGDLWIWKSSSYSQIEVVQSS